MRGRRQIGGAEFVGVDIAAEQFFNPGAVGPWRGPENAIKPHHAAAVAGAARRGERIVFIVLVARGDRLHCRVDQRDLRRK
jgi:hypothetical protein